MTVPCGVEQSVSHKPNDTGTLLGRTSERRGQQITVESILNGETLDTTRVTALAERRSTGVVASHRSSVMYLCPDERITHLRGRFSLSPQG